MTQILPSASHSGTAADLSHYFGLPALPLGLATDIFHPIRRFSLHLILKMLEFGSFGRTQKHITGPSKICLVFLHAQFLTSG
jgi:hypothetical protein